MNFSQFFADPKARFDWKNHAPDFTGDLDKETAQAALKANVKRLAALQDVLYAENSRSLLVIFQALDAAGKDGAIKHVFSGVNPQGCQVASFKAPSIEELEHDFLWRCSKNLPERGKIGIFNRSYYEEVLVARVHPEILEAQRLPQNLKNDPEIWEKRFEQIRNFEKYLHQNGIQVLKFFLNVSRDEQKKRFLDRIAKPEKNWKFSASDVRERRFWNDYQRAYAQTLAATSTPDSPWFVIPADKKWFTRLAVSETICGHLEAMNLSYPEVSKAQRDALLEAGAELESETA